MLVGGPSWFEFEGEGRPHVLRMDLPVSADEMVAALYRDHAILHDTDLAVGRYVREHAALVIAMDGLNSVQDTVDLIRAQERRGELAAPEWLALCRQRVTRVTGVTGMRQEPTWRDEMRPEVENAWHALDRAQIILYHEYASTGDEQVRRLKHEFERATDAFIDVVIDELFPEPGTDDATDDDEKAAGSA
jgi:hypothetical protein